MCNERIKQMAITLNHTVLPAKDNEVAACFFAHVMGLPYNGPERHFAPVRVNETLTLDFCTAQDFQGHHLAFHVGADEFEAILSRLQAMGLSYGNNHRELTNMKTDHPFGGKGVYFLDPSGHLFEIMTKVAAS